MKTVFSNGNQQTGVPGTVLTAEFLNKIFAQAFAGVPEDGYNTAFKKGAAAVASPANGNLVIDPTLGNVFDISGANTITTITITNSTGGTHLVLRFTGALTLTHSNSLMLPSGKNILTNADTIVLFVEESGGVWRAVAVTGHLPTPTTHRVDTIQASLAIGGSINLTLPSAGSYTRQLITVGVHLNYQNSNGTALSPRFKVQIKDGATVLYDTATATENLGNGQSVATGFNAPLSWVLTAAVAEPAGSYTVVLTDVETDGGSHAMTNITFSASATPLKIS